MKGRNNIDFVNDNHKSEIKHVEPGHCSLVLIEVGVGLRF